MIKILAQDNVNDVTLIQTAHQAGLPNYHVRYGLQITPFVRLEDALKDFGYCQIHALHCDGHIIG